MIFVDFAFVVSLKLNANIRILHFVLLCILIYNNTSVNNAVYLRILRQIGVSVIDNYTLILSIYLCSVIFFVM